MSSRIELMLIVRRRLKKGGASILRAPSHTYPLQLTQFLPRSRFARLARDELGQAALLSGGRVAVNDVFLACPVEELDGIGIR